MTSYVNVGCAITRQSHGSIHGPCTQHQYEDYIVVSISKLVDLAFPLAPSF